ncbi:hypothetical protein MMC07_000463 [Pseudocyphellaria aurata]|nr:hypothetical protein [Pseudocyphellaria aurata]
MAPRKEKADKTSNGGGNAENLIVNYLKQQNRPYSATDISANLHNKVTKTYATKALKELHESQLIAGKAAGKQIVYHALQDPSDAVSLDDLAAMDKQIHDLGEAIATAKAHEKLLRANLIAVNATQSTDDLRASIITLESEKKEILARLGPLRSGTVAPVSTADKDEVDQAWKMWSRAASARKRIGLELWELCTEEMQAQAKEDLWDELGLENAEI